MPRFAQPPKRRRENLDGGTYDDWRPQPPIDSSRPRGVSSNAQDSIDNIDEALLQNAALRHGEEEGDNESTYESSGSESGREGHLNNNASERLSEQEKDAETPYDTSAMDDIKSRLGFNYSGDPDRQTTSQKRLNRWFSGNSKIKKRASIAVASLGVTAAIGVLVGFLMLPLKIVSFVGMIEDRAGAAVNADMDAASEHLLSGFIRHNVLPALNTKRCKSTLIDPTCVVAPKSTNPVRKMYSAWAQNRVQYDMAKNTGIIVGINPTTKKYYMTVKGRDVGTSDQWEKVRRGEITLKDLDAYDASSATIKRTLKENTKSHQVWLRYKYWRLLKQRGVKPCVFACTPIVGDKVAKLQEKIEDRRMAGRLMIVSRVSNVVGESYGLFLGCVMDPDTCDTKLSASTNGTEPKTKFQQNLDIKLNAYIAAHGAEKLSKISERAKNLRELGVGGYTADLIASHVGGFFGGEAGKAATRTTVGKAVPFIGWVSLAIDMRHFMRIAPELIKDVRYASSAAASLSLFATYQSAASEIKSGNVDNIAVGDLSDTLSAKYDMTSHPVYGLYQTSINSSPASSMSQLLSGKAFAATEVSSWSFPCDDGKRISSGKYECYEENFQSTGALGMGEDAARKSCSVLPNCEAMFFEIPIIDPILEFAHGVYKAILSGLTAPVNLAFEKTCGVLPKCPALLGGITKAPAAVFNWFMQGALPNQWVNPSGGRNLAMSTAGAQIGFEKAHMVDNGAAPITNELYAEIQQQSITEKNAEFRGKPFFARLGDTSTPYSLISRISLAMPSQQTMASSSLMGVLSNPFDRFGSALGGFMPDGSGSAAGTPLPATLFGIKHYGYSLGNAPAGVAKSELDSYGRPKFPDVYWDAHCEGRDFKKEYLEKMTPDPDTMQATSRTTEPCLLIESSIQANGAKYDASFIPEGAANADAGTSPTNTSDPGDLFGDSSTIPCYNDPATPELDTIPLGVQDGYHDMEKVPIAVCAVTSIASQAGESNPNDTYFIPKSDGMAIVNARMSEHFYKLGVDMAKDSTIGGKPVVASAFRSMPKQENLCAANYLCRNGDYTYVARPGTSNHQMGLALDFSGPSSRASTSTCTGRATEPSSPIWVWLEANARRYGGLQQYTNESWHWDPLGGANRCGGGPPSTGDLSI